jgi:hypothetical protein
MLDLSKSTQRSVYANKYFVVVGDVSENTRMVELGEWPRKTLVIGLSHAPV